MDSTEAGEIARKHAEKMGFKEVKILAVENKLLVAGTFYYQAIVRADGVLYQLNVYDTGATFGWKAVE